MRFLLPTLAIAVLASPVLASSIEPVASGGPGQGSVKTISCAECPALKEEEKASTYVVPEIEPGTQKVEIREVDGEKKMFRSEAWFGGSPVVFVSKAPEEAVDTAISEAAGSASTLTETANAIDADATTGALDASAAKHVVNASASAKPTESRELDASTFELRLN